MTKLALTLLVLFAGMTHLGAAPAADRERFVANATQRLAAVLPEVSQVRIAELLRKWQQSRSETDFRNLVDLISALAKDYKVRVKVKVTATGGPGAVVSYQTPDERAKGKIYTAKRTTVVVEEMCLGEQYIWAERGVEVTSNKDRLYLLARVQEEVELVEDGGGKKR